MGPPPTVITIEEPITSNAVMIPMVMRVDGSVEAITEAVQTLQIEVDPHAPAAGIFDETGKVTRH